MIVDNHLALGGRLWCEPMTVATDGLLAMWCVVLAARVQGAARVFFGLMALAFGLGGLRHLIYAEWHALVAPLSAISSTAGSLALAALVFALPSPRWAQHLAVVLAVVFALGHLLLNHIALPIAHSAVVFFGIQGAVLASGQGAAYRWFGLALGLALVAAGVFALRLSPMLWFNHNDLAHIVLLGVYGALGRQLRAG